MKVTVIPIIISALGTVNEMLGKGSERVGNWRRNRDHVKYSIKEKSEKASGDLRRLAVTQQECLMTG